MSHGGGLRTGMWGATVDHGPINGGGPMVAPGEGETTTNGSQGATNGGGPMVAPMGGDTKELGSMNGGGTQMDVDKELNDHDSNKHKGTIRACFSKMHFKGMKTTNKFQGDRINGGGSSLTTTTLKTTMKKVRNSKKNLGVLPKRGAKSRMLREQLTRDQKSVSSQMEIRHFFSKDEG